MDVHRTPRLLDRRSRRRHHDPLQRPERCISTPDHDGARRGGFQPRLYRPRLHRGAHGGFRSDVYARLVRVRPSANQEWDSLEEERPLPHSRSAAGVAGFAKSLSIAWNGNKIVTQWKKTMFVDRRRLLLGLALCPACAAGAWAEAHWSYGGDGAPEKWGTLDSEFRACSIGTEQSPIDLKDAVNADLPSMSIAWRPQQYEVGNNGHTIQLNAAPGDSLTLDGRVYEFKQFHFHKPSEHAVDGKRLAMEAHFVHAQANGGLAV